MIGMILKRIAIGIFTVIAVSLIIFLGTQVLPGDAAEIRMGQEATEANIAEMRRRLGLDQPLIVQYGRWFGNFLQGDLGVSLSSDRPVTELIANRYQNTLFVSVMAACIGIPISLGLGILAAMFPGSIYDRALTMISVTLVASPEFFTATLLVLIFVMGLGLGSSVVVGSTQDMGPMELLGHFILPVITLCFVVASQLIRMTRAAVLNVLSSPYIEMAILKGMPRHRIILRHALRNAIGPIVNVVALNLAYLVAGVVVIEVFFGYQGLAVLMVQGVQTRDFVVVQSIGMIFCLVYVTLMLIADLVSIVSNPRLRGNA